MTCKKASILLAFLYLIFSSRRYAEMALDHNLWINLQSDDLKVAYEKGNFPKDGWREDEAPTILEDRSQLIIALWKAFFITCLIVFIVVCFGLYFGSLDLKLNFNGAKLTSFVGGSVAAWGAIFQLICPNIETSSKKTLNEIMQKSIFFILFAFGAIISLLGLVL